MDNEMRSNRILIVEKGRLCHYNTLLDLIVISKCYYDDPEVFDFVLKHEMVHREIHLKHGYWGVLHHVVYDWRARLRYIYEGIKYRKEPVRTKGGRDFLMTKELIIGVIYAVLTVPIMPLVGVFQLSRMFVRYVVSKGE